MSQSDPTVVDTPCGRVRGARDGAVTRFLGVPYALAPTGIHRFAPPRPLPDSPAAHMDATARAGIPPQLPSRLAKVMGDYPARQDEDCLHLDIWVPDERAARAPVFVFLHGGAFMTGGGSLPCYNGAVLARRTGMIVVNITYRLGVLGFLPIAGRTLANLGVRDQIAALRWIRRTIGAFGGDPANVTVAGQSAGAASIAILQNLPEGRELFDRAILLSAPLGVELSTPELMRERSDIFTRAVGIDAPSPEALARLSAEDILRGQVQILRQSPANGLGNVTPPFMPTLDGEIVPRPLLAAVQGGAAAWCDTLIGSTREEFAAFYLDDAAIAGLDAQAVIDAYTACHGAEGAARYAQATARRAPATPGMALADLRTEQDFAAPTRAYAQAMADTGRAPFVYRFDWQSPEPAIGACHCIELPFLFGNLETWASAPMVAGAPADELVALSRTFQDLCAAFAHTGRPAGGALPAWPAYGAGGPMLHIDRLTEARIAVR